MIPKYPYFVKIRLSHKDEVERITSQFEPYSDFNFTSLLCWNGDDTTELSKLKGNLVIKIADYTTGKSIYSILGKDHLEYSIKLLLSDVNVLHLVPQAVVEPLMALSGLVVNESPDHFDYIYQVSDLVTFGSKNFKKKRNKLNSARKALNQTLEVRNMHGVSMTDSARLKRLFNKWAVDARLPKDDLESERKAIDRALAYATLLDLIVTEFLVEGEPVAFSINEIISKDYAICHFEKAILIHDNMYTVLVQEVAMTLQAEGSSLVNWEQDLGLPGLRQSKTAYSPLKFLKKYTISLSE